MPAKDHTISWWQSDREAKFTPDPQFPEGRDVDISLHATLRCTVALDHPAPGFGAWIVECRACGARVACSAAGLADDPRSVKIACQPRESQKSFL